MKPKIIATEDGSHSLFLENMDESYHSTHGAIQESNHVFIEAGFKQIEKNEFSVLEVGFGTGLNALLTRQHALETEKCVRYFTLEKYPLGKNIWEKLNHGTTMGESAQQFYQAMHSAPWNQWIDTDAHLHFYKAEVDWLTFDLSQVGSFDLVYFDAFAPGKQPEMWGADAFKRIYEQMNNNGILVTYCAKGQVRRDLQAAGFTVERIPGPPGKREMLRARKQ
ncbi:SAM-dependent methyltransferase [Prolixibacteraceae bacterium JC049]|nr:SAM-dependent methyltransferase [Prolixibacteraceae bacterium JC049]